MWKWDKWDTIKKGCLICLDIARKISRIKPCGYSWPKVNYIVDCNIIMNKKVLELLEKLGIKYEIHDHKAIYTIEEWIEIDKQFKGRSAKSLLLKEKKKDNYFLAVLEWHTRMDLKLLSKQVWANKWLSFASPERLKEKLNITPWSVSPFALIYNEEKDIKLIFDNDLLKDEFLSFHPNINTQTIDVPKDEFMKFLDYLDNEVFIYDFENNEIINDR